MADGFDACVCDWDHGMAMRRLVSLLRGMQGECTDNECFAPSSTTPAATVGHGDMMMLTVVWAVLALFLYMMRPSSLRNRGDEKPARQNRDFDGNSQPPAPTI